MTNNITRILTEAVVKNTLKDIEDSPERSIRRLVDMALNFSKGRFRSDFFEMAQKMLENENSPYYDLIRDAVTHVDHDRILQFGMNVGFNSCTEGARTIRKHEETLGFNIPWSISLHLDQQKMLEEMEQYSRIISQGEKLGVYTWLLAAGEPLAEVLPLMREHSDSAFILVCDPESVTEEFLESAAQIHNMLPVVRYEEERTEVFARLRERRYLYAVYQSYGDRNAESILRGDLFYSAEQVHAVLTALLPGRDCAAQTRIQVAEYVKTARNEQLFKTIPWETWYDSCRVDAIISGDACFVDFDAQGYLCDLCDGPKEASLNIFQNDLTKILQKAFPKKDRTAVVEGEI